jgi:RHS repeat-associated protein
MLLVAAVSSMRRRYARGCVALTTILAAISCQGVPPDLPSGGFSQSVEAVYLADNLGTPVVTVSGRGDVVGEVSDRAYGVIRTSRGKGGVSPWSYLGNELDAATGFTDCGARPYASQLGRFLSIDPAMLAPDASLVERRPGVWSSYAYSAADPINAADEGGQIFHIVGGAVGGAVIGLGIELAKQIVTNEYDTGALAIAAGQGAVTGAFGAATGGAGLALKYAGAALGSMVAGAGARAVRGQETGLLDLGVDGLTGAASFGFGRALAKSLGATLKAGAELSKEAQRSIRSLQKQIATHEKKLAEFKTNPTVRPGMEELPIDIIRKAQERRILHLEREIQTFKNNIDKVVKGASK